MQADMVSRQQSFSLAILALFSLSDSHNILRLNNKKYKLQIYKNQLIPKSILFPFHRQVIKIIYTV